MEKQFQQMFEQQRRFEDLQKRLKNKKKNLKTKEKPIMMKITLALLILGLLFPILGFVIKIILAEKSFYSDYIVNSYFGLVIIVIIILKILPDLRKLLENFETKIALRSITCICCDKTGTLTQNKMTVENIWYNGRKRKAHNKDKMGPHYSYQYDQQDQTFQFLNETAIISSQAIFDKSLPQQNRDQISYTSYTQGLSQAQKELKLEQATAKWQREFENLSSLEKPVIGDASETALIQFFQPIFDIEDTRRKYKIALDQNLHSAIKPYNSMNKYAFTIVEQQKEDSDYCLLMKGVPERIWNHCSHIYYNDKKQPIDDYWNKEFENIITNFGKQGERAFGFSRIDLPKQEFPKGFNFDLEDYNFPIKNQGFIGLISFIDPLKDNVPEAIQEGRSAGIQCIMITGDQPVTATAQAKQCNIITEKTVNEIMEENEITYEEAFPQSNALVIHGDSINQMVIKDEELPENEKGKQLQEWLQKSELVFARTSPSQKQIIVAGCQKRGHVVAATGDGINDLPAIIQADIGITMGGGSIIDVKDAADIILQNDDFANLLSRIVEAKKNFNSFNKSIIYFLTSNISELLPLIGFCFFGFPSPLTTISIFFIELRTDVLASLNFGIEEPDVNVTIKNNNGKLVEDQLIAFFTFNQIYVLEGFYGFIQYFLSLNDLGFSPSNLYFFMNKEGIIPKPHDVYDPYDQWFGNSHLKENYLDGTCQGTDLKGQESIEWTKHGTYDLRMVLLKCENGKIIQNMKWSDCKIDLLSPITNRPYCYHTEAFMYSQTSFLISIVFGQIVNYQLFKQQQGSAKFNSNYLSNLGFSNASINLVHLFQLFIILSLSYIQPLNNLFGMRNILFIHYGIFELPIVLSFIVWKEDKKNWD